MCKWEAPIVRLRKNNNCGAFWKVYSFSVINTHLVLKENVLFTQAQACAVTGLPGVFIMNNNNDRTANKPFQPPYERRQFSAPLGIAVNRLAPQSCKTQEWKELQPPKHNINKTYLYRPAGFLQLTKSAIIPSTHPKWLIEGFGAAVQRVGDRDQRGFGPAVRCTILILVLSEIAGT